MTIDPPPTCEITCTDADDTPGDCATCEGGNVTLSVAAGYATYEWTKVGNATVLSSTNELEVFGSGNYTVTITDADGCQSECWKLVTIDPPPTCEITCTDADDTPGDCATCEGGNVTLSVAAGYATYEWTKVGNATVLSSTNELEVFGSGNYTVTITDADGCQSECWKLVTINQPPTCEITCTDADDTPRDCATCEGGNVTLSVAAGYATYEWTKVGNATVLSSTNELEVFGSGNYTVTITDADGCQSECWKVVTIDQPPTCEITCTDADDT
ncbi:unnamed protein product, partial [marine sediment metagenome]